MQKSLRLSGKNYSGDSLAAIGIAAHEAGHALQHKTGYAPMMLRSAIVPIASLGSNLAFIAFAIGMFLAGDAGKTIMLVAIFLFSAAFVFTLITLPVEFNASKRAVAVLTESGIISQDEIKPVKKVLNAAALTYVASAVQVLLILLYMLMRYRGRN